MTPDQRKKVLGGVVMHARRLMGIGGVVCRVKEGCIPSEKGGRPSRRKRTGKRVSQSREITEAAGGKENRKLSGAEDQGGTRKNTVDDRKA